MVLSHSVNATSLHKARSGQATSHGLNSFLHLTINIGQLVVNLRAILSNSAPVQHQNIVGMYNRGQPMGNNHTCPPLAEFI
jgi:hypothetical protein